MGCHLAESLLSRCYKPGIAPKAQQMNGDSEVWQVVLLMGAVVLVLMLLAHDSSGGDSLMG